MEVVAFPPAETSAILASMCGIGGVLFDNDLGDEGRRVVARLHRALAHRGPDGRGMWLGQGRARGVALAHTRLAVVARDDGAQPIVSDDGRYALVMNGEIYGHDALRARLFADDGVPFRGRGDAEVLLRALVRHGAAAVDVIEGEYAFCFVDVVARRALLGRDPLGVKPLVYARRGRAVWFASEAQALAQVLPERPSLDDDVIAETLFCPPLSGALTTPFTGVEVLPPGSLLHVDDDGARVRRFFAFRFDDGTAADDDADDANERDAAMLGDALDVAVAERLVADDDVAVFLSGGLDSSAIAASALRARGADAQPLTAFSIRFDNHNDVVARGGIVVGDDAPFTERLAREWHLTLHRVHASRDALVDELTGLARTQDRLPAWEQELTQRILARAARPFTRAVLVGDAADETHWGYAFALDDAVCASPAAFFSRFGGDLRARLLAHHLRARVPEQLASTVLHEGERDGAPFAGDVVRRRRAMAALLVRRWLPRLLHNGDVHTMAFGLEARVPFADRRVLAVASRVGAQRGFSTSSAPPEKRVLRRAVRRSLPDEIVRRDKSALPRDGGLGPRFCAALAPLLHDDRARLARFVDVDAALALCATGAHDDGARAAVFSVLGLAGFLRAHAAPRAATNDDTNDDTNGDTNDGADVVHDVTRVSR